MSFVSDFFDTEGDGEFGDTEDGGEKERIQRYKRVKLENDEIERIINKFGEFDRSRFAGRAQREKEVKAFSLTDLQGGFQKVIQQRKIRLNVNQFEYPSTILHFLYNKKPWYIVPVLVDLKGTESTFKFVIHKYYETNFSTVGLNFEILLFLDQWWRSTDATQNVSKNLAVFLFTILYYGLNVNGDDYAIHVWNYNIMEMFKVKQPVRFICETAINQEKETGNITIVDKNQKKQLNIWDLQMTFGDSEKTIALQPYGPDVVGFILINPEAERTEARFTLKEFHDFIERTFHYHFKEKQKGVETEQFNVLLKTPNILKMNLYRPNPSKKTEFWCRTQEYSGDVWLFMEEGLMKCTCGNNTTDAYEIRDFKVFLSLVTRSIKFIKNNFIFFQNEFYVEREGKNVKYLYNEKDSLSVKKYFRLMKTDKSSTNINAFYNLYLNSKSLVSSTEGTIANFENIKSYYNNFENSLPREAHVYELDEDREISVDGNLMKIKEEVDKNIIREGLSIDIGDLKNEIKDKTVIVYLRDRKIPKKYFIINKGSGKRLLDKTGIAKIFRRYNEPKKRMDYYAVLNPIFGDHYKNINKMINIMAENKMFFTFDRLLHNKLEENEILKYERGGEAIEEELLFEDFSFGVNYWQVNRMNKFRWSIRRKENLRLLHSMFSNFLGMVKNITSLTNIMSSETVINLKREIDLIQSCVKIWSGQTGMANEITNKYPKSLTYENDHRVNIDNLFYVFEDIGWIPSGFTKFMGYVKKVQVPINMFDDLLCEDETNTLIRALERVRRRYERMKIIIPKGAKFNLSNGDFTEKIISGKDYTELTLSREDIGKLIFSDERKQATEETKSQRDYYKKLKEFREKIQMRGIKKMKKTRLDFQSEGGSEIRQDIDEFKQEELPFELEDSDDSEEINDSSNVWETPTDEPRFKREGFDDYNFFD